MPSSGNDSMFGNKSNMNSFKKCRVCSGIASGFNYDGLSCESCKVFFCRNYARIETLNCNAKGSIKGNCEITISTRKKCPKCRLVKCYAIGMKKSEESNCMSPVENKTLNGTELILEMSIVKHISEYDIEQIEDYISNQSNIQPIQNKRLPIELTPYELSCIAEARNAISVFRDERSVKVIKHIKNNQELVDSKLFHNMLYIKKTINFCQNFAAFNSLPCEDQLLLLKPFCFNLMEIRFTFHDNIGNNGTLMFSDESETETIFLDNEMANNYKNQEIIQNMMKFSISLYDAMEKDVNIRDLISTLILFKTQHNLSCPENIRYHYHLYSSILLRYLQHKCQNKKEANRKYLSLMRLLDRMDNQFNEHRKMFALEFGAHNMPSIFRELYDLE